MSFTKHFKDGLRYIERLSPHQVEKFTKYLKYDLNSDGLVHFENTEVKEKDPLAWEYAMDKDTKNTQHTILSSQVFEKLNGEKSVADWITDAIDGNVQTYSLELLDKKY